MQRGCKRGCKGVPGSQGKVCCACAVRLSMQEPTLLTWCVGAKLHMHKADLDSVVGRLHVDDVRCEVEGVVERIEVSTLGGRRGELEGA